jgi:hypothetical protein
VNKFRRIVFQGQQRFQSLVIEESSISVEALLLLRSANKDKVKTRPSAVCSQFVHKLPEAAALWGKERADLSHSIKSDIRCSHISHHLFMVKNRETISVSSTLRRVDRSKHLFVFSAFFGGPYTQHLE